ncbi:MAG TPA: FlgD immunoglobulin-like domain containing protein, partial [Candidatus Binatia bacterium]|nr:FlgD immunoglobulin-like domain containing protein [Candidatus Binatia bacterium]
PEVEIDFARADFTRLFDQVRGRTTVSADVAGSLTDGRAFCTDVALTIVDTGQPHQVAFAPNPLNPQSKLSFTTEREGPARALLFDIHGRLVRRILDQSRLPVGAHEFTFDGKTDRGAALSSGVYFYRVESTGGRSEGQIVILK